MAKESRGSTKVRVPRITLMLMALFLVGGSLGLVIDWPPGPANLDWGVWLMVYGGYIYVVAAAFFYAKTGK
jgi:selenophosphate synthetase-related protein